MDAAEMQEEFLILYDKITNFDAPGYTDEEISRFLSRAQERFILHVYNPMANKYVTGFEGTEKRRKDLSALVRDVDITPAILQTGAKADGKFFELPTDFLYTIQEEAEISSSDPCYNPSTGVEVKPITHDYYLKNKKNPYKKPYGELIWRLDFSPNVAAKRHELITDTATTVTKYSVRYIKKPDPIITDATVTIEDVTGVKNCELHPITHRAIVDEAVAIAAGITNPETFQIRRMEAGLSE